MKLTERQRVWLCSIQNKIDVMLQDCDEEEMRYDSIATELDRISASIEQIKEISNY